MNPRPCEPGSEDPVGLWANSEPVPTPTSSVTPGKFNEETRVLKTQPSQGCDMGQMRKHTKELSPTLCTD